MRDLSAVEQAIGHSFSKKELLAQALTHRSAGEGHNQRLEFLGDSVLGLLIAEMLFELYPNEPEGDLSKRLVALVNGAQLSEIAHAMHLNEYLAMSSSEEEQGGRQNPSNLEDACEAVLGAVYLDGGLEAAHSVIQKFWKPRALERKAPPKDAKTALQEWAQARALPLPEYIVLSSEGPSHAPQFVIEVRVNGKTAKAEGGTKKVAERLAAEALLKQLT